MIVVIGEALIDLIENRYQPGAFNAIVGGANLNVAIALARRGTPQTFLARIGNDRFGKLIRERLVTNSVNLEHAIDASELTTLAVVSIDSQGVPSYSFYVNGTADWGWTPAELPSGDALKALGTTAIQFGCLTMAMEPGNKVIEAWARPLSGEVTISHDINMRPALGFDAEFERKRVERVNEFSHLIKASDEDIQWLYQDENADIDAIVGSWIGDTDKHVFVTRGGDGVSIYRKSGSGVSRADVPSRKINVVDTVGAGDTFCANLLGQLEDRGALGSSAGARLAAISDADLAAMVHVAGVAASITCERAGAEPPTLADLNAVLSAL